MFYQDFTLDHSDVTLGAHTALASDWSHVSHPALWLADTLGPPGDYGNRAGDHWDFTKTA